MNILDPVRITPCPPRLKLQISGTGGILTEETAFWRDKCLAKVVHNIKTVLLNITTPVKLPHVPIFLEAF